MSEKWKRRIYSFVIGSLLVMAVSGCKPLEQQPVVGEKISDEVMGLPEPTLSAKATLPTEPTTMPETTATESPEATYEPSVKENPAKAPMPTPSVVTLCLTGDLMCLGGQQNAAAKKGGGYDFSGSFALIKDYLQGCDFAIGNLETVISPGFPYTAQMKYVEEDCPNCNAPPEYLEAVRDAGFDVVFTCNNHSLDAGASGINETIQNLDRYGLLHTGTYEENADQRKAVNGDEEAEEIAGQGSSERFVLVEKSGIRIGLVAFTELINLRDSLPTEELEQRINCYGKRYATELISAAREAGADFIIAYNHWGSENTHEVRDYQREHARVLAEAGADFVVGSHPHCLQESELLRTEDEREVPCFYSLGNLVSSMLRDINNDTILVTLTLCRRDGRVVLDATEITACHVLSYLNGKPHVIVPVSYPVGKMTDREELLAAEARILEVLSMEP